MAGNNIDSSKELVDSVSKLVKNLESFPLTSELFFLISFVVVFSAIYFITKMIIEYCKSSKFDRLLEKNTAIIGECKETMRHVYNALERL